MESPLTSRALAGGDGLLDGYSSSLACFTFLFEGSIPVIFSRLRSCVDKCWSRNPEEKS